MEIFEFQPSDNTRPRPAIIDFHHMGIVDFDQCVALQKRLVYESGGRDDGHITCLLCEHPPLISIGRAGSRRHIRLTTQEMRRRKLELRWIGRGGACVAHTPGQLAVYPIVPLRYHSWSVGDYLQRLQNGLLDTVREYEVPSYKRPGRFGLWGRSGMLAAIGVAVQNWITSHGAFLNVTCGPHSQVGIESNPAELACPGDSPTMSSLLEETESCPTIREVARSVAYHLAQRFGAVQATWHSSHPLFPEVVKHTRDRTRQAAC
ncbi:lipoyl(octanoyl) transferase LipB [Bremerella sp. T1]|uniref:lipoyl(octanoyl) transferase LipB n=1 Tax=Bremerella sp. TYQ1 TaxID=3119568 RepID=UPI001CCB1E58|nr:hypothetical protein [Bremerella volcania]UBM35552.1 hypothetical protein LA756_23095 [Bremerella volcania]